MGHEWGVIRDIAPRLYAPVRDQTLTHFGFRCPRCTLRLICCFCRFVPSARGALMTVIPIIVGPDVTIPYDCQVSTHSEALLLRKNKCLSSHELSFFCFSSLVSLQLLLLCSRLFSAYRY